MPLQIRRRAALLALLPACAVAQQNTAAESATLLVGSAGERSFTLSASSPEQPVGGEIRIGERRFTITQVSRHGLIGAQRSAGADERDAPFAEYAVFSSSFSPQTASGTPWVAARNYRGCERPYNSFLAIYRIAGSTAALSLTEGPFSSLTESVNASSESTVYCFLSRPPNA